MRTWTIFALHSLDQIWDLSEMINANRNFFRPIDMNETKFFNFTRFQLIFDARQLVTKPVERHSSLYEDILLRIFRSLIIPQANMFYAPKH